MVKRAKLFKPGDKVFAKVRGYPFWPARVESEPDDTPKPKYHVYFYGTGETAFVKTDDICDFVENKEKHGKPKKQKGFNEAIIQIEAEIAAEADGKQIPKSGKVDETPKRRVSVSSAPPTPSTPATSTSVVTLKESQPKIKKGERKPSISEEKKTEKKTPTTSEKKPAQVKTENKPTELKSPSIEKKVPMPEEKNTPTSDEKKVIEIKTPTSDEKKVIEIKTPTSDEKKITEIKTPVSEEKISPLCEEKKTHEKKTPIYEFKKAIEKKNAELLKKEKEKQASFQEGKKATDNKPAIPELKKLTLDKPAIPELRKLSIIPELRKISLEKPAIPELKKISIEKQTLPKLKKLVLDETLPELEKITLSYDDLNAPELAFEPIPEPFEPTPKPFEPTPKLKLIPLDKPIIPELKKISLDKPLIPELTKLIEDREELEREISTKSCDEKGETSSQEKQTVEKKLMLEHKRKKLISEEPAKRKLSVSEEKKIKKIDPEIFKVAKVDNVRMDKIKDDQHEKIEGERAETAVPENPGSNLTETLPMLTSKLPEITIKAIKSPEKNQEAKKHKDEEKESLKTMPGLEVMSRSGRKIKPSKRFAEMEEEPVQPLKLKVKGKNITITSVPKTQPIIQAEQKISPAKSVSSAGAGSPSPVASTSAGPSTRVKAKPERRPVRPPHIKLRLQKESKLVDLTCDLMFCFSKETKKLDEAITILSKMLTIEMDQLMTLKLPVALYSCARASKFCMVQQGPVSSLEAEKWERDSKTIRDLGAQVVDKIFKLNNPPPGADPKEHYSQLYVKFKDKYGDLPIQEQILICELPF